MANTVYATGKAAFLSAGVNLTSDTIKIAMVSASYTPNAATDQFWSTVSANVIGTPVALTGVTVTGGVFKSSNVTYSVPASSTCKYLVIYKDTGTASTSQLICYDDTAASSGLPYTSGSSTTAVTISPDATNGWFSV